MQYLLNEQEYSEFKSNQVNLEHLQKLESAAKEYIKTNGCKAQIGGYCTSCPFKNMLQYVSGPNYCIAGRHMEL